MLKKLYSAGLAAALALTGLGAHAQTNPGGNHRGTCGFDEQQEAYFAAHPGARLLYDAVNQQLAALPAPAQQRGGLAVPNVTIPVVVHIIHAGGVDNISDRQINSALAELNDDYQKLNGDTGLVSPLFRPIAANLQFQFKLAKKDPNGNCTTGITRTYAPELVNDDRAGTVKARIFWDSNRYLNMWIVSTIGTPQPGGGFILGYAQFPGQNPATDGLVMRHDYFGNQGTGSPGRSAERTATHEVGHYFGLLHTWGNGAVETPGNCGGTGDLVADTPPTIGTFGCDLTFAPCTVVSNVNNFMDYSACTRMFTQGQKTRMVNVLNTIRTSLTTPANLLASGTNDGYVAPNCPPIAAFAPLPGTSTKVCINTDVTLRDYSYNFTAAGGQLTYTWSAPGATIVGTPGQTVTLRYATAGIYSVTNTVTNTAGSGTSTQANLIVVEGPTGAETAPYAESFENAAFPNLFAAPSLRNYETFGTTGAGAAAPYRWNRRTALPAANGSAYLFGANRLYPAGAVTTLISPNINLSGVTQAVLRLARAYAPRNAADNAQLRVSFSSNCGVSWSSPSVFNVADLTTRGLTPIDGFAPAQAADWQDLSVAIPAQFQGSGLFKVRLELVNGTTQGNDLYLDHLRVVSVLGTKADALAARGISVFPNPLTNETAVHLTLATATQVQLRLTDVLGRDVLALPAKTYGAGPLALPLQTAGRPLRAGLYVVRISLNGETFSSKLTVE